MRTMTSTMTSTMRALCENYAVFMSTMIFPRRDLEVLPEGPHTLSYDVGHGLALECSAREQEA